MSVNYASVHLSLFLMASRLILTFTCALLSGAAGAAELGEPHIRSYLGQQLQAEIELTMLDAPASPVQVRLAHPDVYRGASIGMPHVLSTLNMAVTQRDGRQFVQVTSLAPVESRRLHLYLELADGGQRDVRHVTLQMSPDPSLPSPSPSPLAPPSPPAQPSPPPAPAAVRRPAPAPRPAPQQGIRPAPPAQGKPAPAALPTPPTLPTSPASPISAPPPAACASSADIDRSTVCAALDHKNAQLREQIGRLEDKVKVLQVALGADRAAAGKPHPSPPPAPQRAALAWGWVAGGAGVVLALAGAAAVLLRRRYARKRASSGPVEPRLEDTEQETSTQV